MKGIKQDIELMNQTKKEYEEQQKNFLITLKKRSSEFKVVRFLFGIFHLIKVLEKKEILTRELMESNSLKRGLTLTRNYEEEEMELEKKSRDIVREFKNIMRANKLYTSPTDVMHFSHGEQSFKGCREGDASPS